MTNELKVEQTVPTVAAVMIVRDEEANLAKCLDSIKDVVDEIVIVDTGSADKTMDIARSYPTVKLYEHEWTDSFSEARNYSIQMANENTDCDWFLIIDADEMLMGDTGKLLRPVLAEVEASGKNIGVLKCNVINQMPDGEGRHLPERIFRRGNISYSRRAHNQAKYRGACGLCPVTIYHWGYNLDEAAQLEKLKRTERLLKLELADDPYSPISTMYLVKCYRGLKRFEEAVVLSTKFYDHLEEEQLKISPVIDQVLKTDTIVSYQKSGKYDLAMDLAIAAIRTYPHNLDIMWAIATLYSHKGMWQQAIAAHNQFIYMRDMAERTNQATDVIQDSWGYTGAAFHNIAAARLQLNDVPNALLCAYLATELDPVSDIFQQLLYKVFRRAVVEDMVPEFEELGLVHDVSKYRGCSDCGALFRRDGDRKRCPVCEPEETKLEVVELKT